MLIRLSCLTAIEPSTFHENMNRTIFAILGLSFALVSSACGDDSDPSENNTTDTSTNSDDSSSSDKDSDGTTSKDDDDTKSNSSGETTSDDSSSHTNTSTGTSSDGSSSTDPTDSSSSSTDDPTDTSGTDGDCESGKVKCGDTCVDINSDVLHCGACDKACSDANIEGLTCEAGECKGTCKTGYDDCNADLRTDGCEIDLNTDADNCGACADDCSILNVNNRACEAGQCKANCQDGYGDCNGDLRADGCEINLNTDVDHCGACMDAACMGDELCEAGECVLECTAPEVECGSSCANLKTDPDHCGGCDIKCSDDGMENRLCDVGHCGGTCKSGFFDCNHVLGSDGCEIDGNKDPSNCGGCGRVCDDTNVKTAKCSESTCRPVCVDGYADCNDDDGENDGCETDTNTDDENCGGCGVVCKDDESCTMGVCG